MTNRFQSVLIESTSIIAYFHVHRLANALNFAFSCSYSRPISGSIPKDQFKLVTVISTQEVSYRSPSMDQSADFELTKAASRLWLRSTSCVELCRFLHRRVCLRLDGQFSWEISHEAATLDNCKGIWCTGRTCRPRMVNSLVQWLTLASEFPVGRAAAHRFPLTLLAQSIWCRCGAVAIVNDSLARL